MLHFKILALLLAIPSALLAAGAEAPRAMVATDHELATRAAVDVLREGGSAMDAAVTACYVLGVVNLASSGLGGGGFCLYHDAASGGTEALEYRDRVPTGTAKLLAGLRGRKPPRFGGMAAAAPCEAVGLEAARERYGRLPRPRLLAPAIRLAREGFPAGPLLAAMAANYFLEETRTPELDRLMTGAGGGPIQKGELVFQPALAETLERIATQGASGVTEGPVARAIVRAANRHGGSMSLEDLQAMRAHWVKPLQVRYRGFDLYAMPPPASGAATLMALRLLEPTPLPGLGPYSATGTAALARAIQTAVRAKRLYNGDPAFSRIPLDHFLSGAPAPASPGPADDTDNEPEESDTTNVSVIDGQGNAAAMTTSLGAAFGCHVLVPEAGIVLSNHSADFSPGPGLPNAYGVRYGGANSVAPLKAAVSGSTPLLAFRDGKIALAIGGSGSARIPPAVTQCVVNILDHGLTPGQAVAAPRLQVSAQSTKVWFESKFPDYTKRALAVQGFAVRAGVKRASVTAVQALPGRLLGGSDPRKFGVPAGY